MEKLQFAYGGKMKRTTTLIVLFSLVGANLRAGQATLINNGASPGSGQIEVRANAVKKVTLVISDSGANSLVSETGIDFGQVDSDGNVSSTGITGTSAGADAAQYLAPFVFSVNRTGTGNVSLSVRRSIAGNFSATDGVMIEDSAGVVQPLSGAGTSVTVVDTQAEGNFNKQLGIRVHSADSGALSSTLTFTASAL